MSVSSSFPYKSFESWLAVFKQGAAEVNTKLSVDANGKSMVDFMDHAPLHEAFNDMVEPRSLGRAFGSQ